MEEFEDQFNLRKRHPFSRYNLVLNVFQSMMVRAQLTCSIDVSYGDSEGQKLDIFPAKAEAAPVFIFIHGGYFRALDKSQYSYIARQAVKAGYTTVLVNYDLAPGVSVEEIVRQNLSAFTWIKNTIHKWNGDPSRITLCGHSVGAFLSAKILERYWPGGSGITKAALLSGLYDLGPMKRSFLNRELHLSDSDIENLNPVASETKQRPEILVSVGENETEEFIKQSRTYSDALTGAGVRNTFQRLPGIDHYTMSRLLAGRKNPVMDWIFPT
ncbi:MAG: alpha/beta hydrolase [Roseibium sp.]|uniref:alpha/beta hydrolase n=1 Tax=Roseibium sp. TaxID=1936156 RepID=UPI00262AF422|nr:alpha/beta hydrolase [Roseibium sp.]MCV0424229.1 alpha/beta hydrolase [Roseibium sp.]